MWLSSQHTKRSLDASKASDQPVPSLSNRAAFASAMSAMRFSMPEISRSISRRNMTSRVTRAGIRSHAGEILAADQIVTLAVCEDLDLFALVVTGKVRRADGAHPRSSEPPFAGFNDAVLRWAEEAGAPEPYRLNPHVEPIAAVSSVMPAGKAPQAERSIELHPADCQLPATADLESYLIADDLSAPRFEQGDVIFMDREHKPVRTGDLVAVVLGEDQDGILQTVIGRLLLNSRNMVSLNQTMGRRRDIPKRRVQALRRIALCSF